MSPSGTVGPLTVFYHIPLATCTAPVFHYTEHSSGGQHDFPFNLDFAPHR